MNAKKAYIIATEYDITVAIMNSIYREILSSATEGYYQVCIDSYMRNSVNHVLKKEHHKKIIEKLEFNGYSAKAIDNKIYISWEKPKGKFGKGDS